MGGCFCKNDVKIHDYVNVLHYELYDLYVKYKNNTIQINKLDLNEKQNINKILHKLMKCVYYENVTINHLKSMLYKHLIEYITYNQIIYSDDDKQLYVKDYCDVLNNFLHQYKIYVFSITEPLLF